MADYNAVLNRNIREENQTNILQRIDVYSADEEKLISSYYNCDLNYKLRLLHNQYFIDRIPVKVVGSDGYVEYIGV